MMKFTAQLDKQFCTKGVGRVPEKEAVVGTSSTSRLLKKMYSGTATKVILLSDDTVRT